MLFRLVWFIFWVTTHIFLVCPSVRPFTLHHECNIKSFAFRLTLWIQDEYITTYYLRQWERACWGVSWSRKRIYCCVYLRYVGGFFHTKIKRWRKPTGVSSSILRWHCIKHHECCKQQVFHLKICIPSLFDSSFQRPHKIQECGLWFTFYRSQTN